jgi:hypothetical protein
MWWTWCRSLPSQRCPARMPRNSNTIGAGTSSTACYLLPSQGVEQSKDFLQISFRGADPFVPAAHQSLRAILASELDARILGLEIGEPVMLVHGVYWPISLAALGCLLVGILCLVESPRPRGPSTDQLRLAAGGDPSRADITLGQAIQAISFRR